MEELKDLKFPLFYKLFSMRIDRWFLISFQVNLESSQENTNDW